MAFVRILVNPGSHHNSGGPQSPDSQKAFVMTEGLDMTSFQCPIQGLITLMKITGITYFWLTSTI